MVQVGTRLVGISALLFSLGTRDFHAGSHAWLRLLLVRQFPVQWRHLVQAVDRPHRFAGRRVVIGSGVEI